MIGSSRLRSSWGALGLAIGFGWMADGAADSFYLKSGDVVEGDIVQATRNTVTVRHSGTVLPISVSAIDRVVIMLDDGSELSGDLIRWNDGLYEIRSADVVIRVKDGVMVEEDGETGTASNEPEPPSNPTPPKARPTIAMAMQGMPELTMKDGKVLIGTIVHATGSIVTIRLQDGGLVPASRAQIEKVKFSGKDGDIIDGRFLGWSDDVYQLQSGNQEILASLNGEKAAATKLQSPPTQQADLPTSEDIVDSGIDTADAAISPDQELQAVDLSDEAPGDAPASPTEALAQEPKNPIKTSLDEESNLSEATGAGGPVSETAVAALADSETAPVKPDAANNNIEEPNAPRLVEPKVADVGEDSDAVVFQFYLDRPAERPLVILYAATDDTAHAGKDFEAKSGVVTFVTGSEYAEVRVPLIDDDERENNEQFHLFLSSDPEIIQFSQRQVAATINDDD